jgi:predicted negative regulator of RcsB-dependent stress response
MGKWGEDLTFVVVLIVGALAAMWVYSQYQANEASAAATTAATQNAQFNTQELTQAAEETQLEQLMGSFTSQAAGTQPSAPVTTAPVASPANVTSGIS